MRYLILFLFILLLYLSKDFLRCALIFFVPSNIDFEYQVIVLHKLIVSGSEKLAALYNCFLTIICNVSPYCKSLGTVAAVKLVNLFQLFVSPRFFYASESNYVYVAMILETFNNIVQYQYEGNGNLVYALIRRKELFEGLAGLTLAAARAVFEEINLSSNPPLPPKSAAAASSTASKAKPQQNRQQKEVEEDDEDEDEDEDEEEEEGDDDEDDEEEEEEEDVKSSVNVQLFAQSSPTELISTAAVQRSGDHEGEAPSQSRQSSSSSSSSKGRFEPTEQWLQAVKAELPLHTIMRLLKHLVPQV